MGRHAGLQGLPIVLFKGILGSVGLSVGVMLHEGSFGGHR